MINNYTNDTIRGVFSNSQWIQPSIGSSYVPVSNEKIISGVYSATVNEEIIILTDTDPSWFLTAEWQALENEADQDILEGRFTSHDSMDDFIADLDR